MLSLQTLHSDAEQYTTHSDGDSVRKRNRSAFNLYDEWILVPTDKCGGGFKDQVKWDAAPYHVKLINPTIPVGLITDISWCNFGTWAVNRWIERKCKLRANVRKLKGFFSASLSKAQIASSLEATKDASFILTKNFFKGVENSELYKNETPTQARVIQKENRVKIANACFIDKNGAVDRDLLIRLHIQDVGKLGFLRGKKVKNTTFNNTRFDYKNPHKPSFFIYTSFTKTVPDEELHGFNCYCAGAGFGNHTLENQSCPVARAEYYQYYAYKDFENITQAPNSRSVYKNMSFEEYNESAYFKHLRYYKGKKANGNYFSVTPMGQPVINGAANWLSARLGFKEEYVRGQRDKYTGHTFKKTACVEINEECENMRINHVLNLADHKHASTYNIYTRNGQQAKKKAISMRDDILSNIKTTNNIPSNPLPVVLPRFNINPVLPSLPVLPVLPVLAGLPPIVHGPPMKKRKLNNNNTVSGGVETSGGPVGNSNNMMNDENDVPPTFFSKLNSRKYSRY